MTVSQTALNGIPNTSTLRSLETSDIDPNVSALKEKIDNDYAYFNTSYINKRNALLGFLNSILGKTYSFGTNGLPIEKIFDENKLPNDDKICNAGKKAYAYYLKEVLQKLNLLNEHILKGQEALDALKNCTDEAQINKCKTTLEIEDELVKKYLNDFNKYTVVQTLNTTRRTIRNTVDNEPAGIPSTDSVEINYATRGKIWDENGNLIPPKNSASKQSSYIEQMLNEDLTTLDKLRNLTTEKETGFQFITTTLTNKHTEAITNLNDEFGFNVVKKTINTSQSGPSPIALFDELTLLEKLKYVQVYYTQNTNPYHYPEDLKSGIPCMSRDELVQYPPEGNDDELIALGIMPSKENAPKADLVEPGAVELFYVGYLEDSQGAINALAAFMEIKSVALMSQITQQSYRIKALKTYLKMLEIGLQELNNSFEKGEAISPKTYLAIKYAAANQTRTLVNINGSDYIVMQYDGEQETGDYEHYNLSDNNAYIYVKATEDGINEFLGMDYTFVDAMFTPCKDFKDLSDSEIITACDNETKFYNGVSCSGNPIADYNYLYENVTKGEGYTISHTNKHYRKSVVDENQWVEKSELLGDRIDKSDMNPETERMIYNDALGYLHWDYIHYKKNPFSSSYTPINPQHILFADFTDKDDSDDIAKAKAIEYLPKELETVKVKMDTILVERFGGEEINWKKKNDDYKDQWINLVEMWQNVCQTAIENIGSQIDSVNKTIKSLRSKIDTFDSSANRFRDKFYSTTMTVLNKLS